MDILELLYQRMWQLNGRIIQIQNYVKRDGQVISKKDFTLSDIPKIKKKADECSVAIKSIEKFRRDGRKNHESIADRIIDVAENDMLNRPQNVQVSDTTDDDSSNEADPPKNNLTGEPVIDNLRDKFFKECTDEVSIWDGETDKEPKMKKINMTPHNLFEWFKPYLKSNSEPVIDWEGLEKIRNYFGEHDKTPFEHWAYTFLNNLLKNQ